MAECNGGVIAMFYEPMDVNIVTSEDGRSTWPEPKFDKTWSRIDKLRYQAGLIKARTGIYLRFTDASKCSGPEYTYEWPELIGIIVRAGRVNSFYSQFDFEIDTYLLGFEDGAKAVRDELKYPES